MERQKLNLDFTFEIKEISDLNKSFSLARVAIAYAGRNRNMTAISKTAFENALPTLKNVPVVGRYDESQGSFGGHDIKIVTTKDDQIEIVNATTPFGVVPESATQYWEDVFEEDGISHSYLYTDVILWKRQYGYEYLLEKKTISQSMEISFDTYVIDQDGYCIIDNFEFDALCLIDCEPCFESANIQLFSKRAFCDYKSQFSQMLSELKKTMLEQSVKLDFSINKETGKGGSYKLTQEKINEILAEFELTLEDLDFEMSSDMDEATFKVKLDEFKKKRAKCSKTELFAATYIQRREALQNACDPVIVRNEDGEVVSSTHYWVQDFDDQWVYVEKSVYADTNYECTNGRFAYSFDDTAKTATLTSEFELMIMTRLTVAENQKIEEERAAATGLSAAFEAYKASHSVEDSEVEELRTFKKATIDAAREADEIELFSKFDEKLNGDAEYEALKADCKDLTLDEISDKCFSLFGKKTATFAVAKPKASSVKLPVATDDGGDTTPYGDVYEKYLK